MRAAKLFVCALASMLAVGSVTAQGKQKQEPKKTAGEKVRGALPEADRVFSVEERTKITGWFKTNRSGLPPGLAKRDRLPPGLEKQLRERGKLPPGLQKKIQPLPPQLEKELRILPTGYKRVVIAGNVVLMNEKTAVIYAIIRNAIP
jgi:hypothetical protein